MNRREFLKGCIYSSTVLTVLKIPKIIRAGNHVCVNGLPACLPMCLVSPMRDDIMFNSPSPTQIKLTRFEARPTETIDYVLSKDTRITRFIKELLNR